MGDKHSGCAVGRAVRRDGQAGGGFISTQGQANAHIAALKRTAQPTQKSKATAV